MVALFLLAGATKRGERAGAAVILAGQGAGDGQLAAMTLSVAAAAARASGLGTAWSRGMTASRTASAAIFFCRRFDSRLVRRRSCGLRGAAGLLLGRKARLLGSGLFGLAIVFGAAALLLALGDLGAFLALARLLREAQAVFLGLALHALEVGAALRDLLGFGKTARCWCGGLRRRLGRFGDRLRAVPSPRARRAAAATIAAIAAS